MIKEGWRELDKKKQLQIQFPNVVLLCSFLYWVLHYISFHFAVSLKSTENKGHLKNLISSELNP